MTVVLSLVKTKNGLYAAGPDGLFQVDDNWRPISQPQQHLTCCAVLDEYLLVGGLPHGIAYSQDMGKQWQASWLDGVEALTLCLAPSPQVNKDGIILAGTDGSGMLRSIDNGRNWTSSNFGLQSYTILAISWAPPPSANAWPAWNVVFAATEEGLYRSPNGGAGWKRCRGAEGLFQCLAVGSDFHQTGIVLAGAENDGVWRSSDYGRIFQPVPNSPQRVNALTSTTTGWLLSDESGLWHSTNGLEWEFLPNSHPALVLLATSDGVWAGNTDGAHQLILSTAH